MPCAQLFVRPQLVFCVSQSMLDAQLFLRPHHVPRKDPWCKSVAPRDLYNSRSQRGGGLWASSNRLPYTPRIATVGRSFIVCQICHCVYLCFTKQRVTRVLGFFFITIKPWMNLVLILSSDLQLLTWLSFGISENLSTVKKHVKCTSDVTYIKVVLRKVFFFYPAAAVSSTDSFFFFAA